MEINFIIQWKNSVENRTGLAAKVKDMLKTLFDDLSDDRFFYTTGGSDRHCVQYHLSEKDDKVYLQLTNEDSEARAALTLSSIREIIAKGYHRRDLLIICSYDEASLSYCCRLMRPMGIFERHLRELMYQITTKAFGGDWVRKTFPEAMINGIKNRTHGRISDEKITESAFEFLDQGEITTYLFSERYFGYSPEQLIEEQLSARALHYFTREQIIAIIDSHRKTTLWDKLFSNIDGIDKETLDTIREYRNDVMHQHTLDNAHYKSIRKKVRMADKIITQAIAEMKNTIYTEEENRMVYASIGYAVAVIMKGINFAANLNIPDMTSAVNNTLKNILEIYHSKMDLPAIAKKFVGSPYAIPDHSKRIDVDTSAYSPLNGMQWEEKMPDAPKSDEADDADDGSFCAK